MEGAIQVKDILNRPIFSGTKIVAGLSGLSRTVRWVHILEVTDIRTLIHGGELVLTTGTAFQMNESVFLDYVTQLVNAQAAGLCVELGSFKTIPDSILELAERNQFPIIVFPFQVRFVDITEDVHRYLLNRHHKLMDDLEMTARQLQAVHFHEGATRQILSILHQATGYTALFWRLGQRPLFEGNLFEGNLKLPFDLTAQWVNQIADTNELTRKPIVQPLPREWTLAQENPDLCFVIRPVLVLGVKKSILAFVCPQESVNEYLLLLMDKALSTLAQHEFHRVTVQERQVFYEQDLVEHLLRGDEYRLFANPLPETNEMTEPTMSGNKRFAVFLIQTHQTLSLDDKDWFNRRTEIALSMKHLFNRFQLKTYLAVHPDVVTAILELPVQNKHLKNTLERLMNELNRTGQENATTTQGVKGGLGRITQNLRHIRQSSEDAALALQIANQSENHPVVLYEEAGIYRWLSLLSHEDRIHRLIQLDIGSLLEYDGKHGTDLLLTLKTYLDCNQSKQKTADSLFIHRQTLYHRLEQIEGLLNGSLEDAKVRLSLHLSLYYHDYRLQK